MALNVRGLEFIVFKHHSNTWIRHYVSRPSDITSVRHVRSAVQSPEHLQRRDSFFHTSVASMSEHDHFSRPSYSTLSFRGNLNALLSTLRHNFI